MFGLIGFPLSHSFSKNYFTERFQKKGLALTYELLEIEHINNFPQLVSSHRELKGLNVTIPHKQTVIPFLDELSETAARIGAVNVIKIRPDGKKVGYNTDYVGFKDTLEDFLPSTFKAKALILGTGGAAQAVRVALEDLKIKFDFATRRKTRKKTSYTILSYKNIKLEDYRLIINTTPLGMYPNTDTFPPINYSKLNKGYFLYDLVYNPQETEFLKKGKEKGAKTMNGLAMLYAQAEAAATIWGV